VTTDIIPLHAYDLIDQLDHMYPEVIYDPSLSKEEFLMRSGERRLVLSLKRKRAREQEDRNV
jgi:hypothetical protein